MITVFLQKRKGGVRFRFREKRIDMVEKEGLEESISGTEKRKVYLRERIERGVIAICVFPEKDKTCP